jgi:hypothetical protein
MLVLSWIPQFFLFVLLVFPIVGKATLSGFRDRANLCPQRAETRRRAWPATVPSGLIRRRGVAGFWSHQFERDVTGERELDENAVSKRKGIWVGGRPCLDGAPITSATELTRPDLKGLRPNAVRGAKVGAVRR